MAAGLLIVAIVLAICTVIVLLTVRSDIKKQEKLESLEKGKKK